MGHYTKASKYIKHAIHIFFSYLLLDEGYRALSHSLDHNIAAFITIMLLKLNLNYFMETFD